MRRTGWRRRSNAMCSEENIGPWLDGEMNPGSNDLDDFRCLKS